MPYRITLSSLSICLFAASALAQPPGPPGGRERAPVTVDAMVARMLTLDADGDGQLSADEVKDERLRSLFERLDADKNDVVTKDEMIALFTKELTTIQSSGRGGPGGGFGPPPAGRGGNGPASGQRRRGNPAGPRQRRPGNNTPEKDPS